MLLLIITGVPTYLGLTSAMYLIAALALGAWFTAAAIHFHSRRTPRAARSLFFSHIDYLPATASSGTGDNKDMTTVAAANPPLSKVAVAWKAFFFCCRW